MSITAYRWQGDLFCEGDIVAAMTDHEPWSRWLLYGNDPGDADTETELNDLAAMFGINRDDQADVEAHGFPVILTDPPHPPDFCSGCMQWFT